MEGFPGLLVLQDSLHSVWVQHPLFVGQAQRQQLEPAQTSITCMHGGHRLARNNQVHEFRLEGMLDLCAPPQERQVCIRAVRASECIRALTVFGTFLEPHRV